MSFLGVFLLVAGCHGVIAHAVWAVNATLRREGKPDTRTAEEKIGRFIAYQIINLLNAGLIYGGLHA